MWVEVNLESRNTSWLHVKYDSRLVLKCFSWSAFVPYFCITSFLKVSVDSLKNIHSKVPIAQKLKDRQLGHNVSRQIASYDI